MDIAALIPGFGNLAFTLVAFVVALSVIVAVHEFGHYIVGRWSGIHAEVFSLGFGPVLLSRTDNRGTRWQIAAFPFGGYVKFLGDSNAASGRDSGAMDDLTAEERRHTMHGAPLWARAATVIAGPAFNFILSVLVFSGFVWVKGVATDLPVVGEVKTAVHAASVLEPGDRILAVGGTETPDLLAFLTTIRDLPPATEVPYVLERAGARIEVTGPYPLPPYVDNVQPLSAAAEAGMKAGDYVQSIDGQPIQSFDQMRDIVGASGGKPVRLTVLRDGAAVEMTMTPRRTDLPVAGGGFETRWLIGLSGGVVFSPETRTPGVFEGLALGGEQLVVLMQTSLSGFWHMLTGAISACNLNGPIGIAETSGAAASQGLESFVWFIAVLSAAVGLMNLFPIPVLDGGHLVFHIWEAVTGKPPSDRALRVLMSAGLAVLLTMMVFALTNDVVCP